ncbi:MAG: HlyD family efflux transporter periplasmic adaptor subunit [Burkholderiales bacterium]|nr:HlyD family efflux transporter periplasmic adaptor subunit [Burkholderiales bacterium]
MKRIGQVAAVLAMVLAQLLFASDGHAHAEAAPATASAAAAVLEPRVEVASSDVELLGIVEGTRLTVYIDHFATNVPIDGAKLSVERNGESFDAQPAGDGAYRFELPWLATPGAHALLFTLVAPGLSDLLTATLELPATDGFSRAGDALPRFDLLSWSGLPGRYWIAAGLGGAALLAFALVAGSVLRRRRRGQGRLGALLLLAACAAGWVERPAQAHESAPAPVAGSPKQPSRLPDGSVFVPMPAQRAIGLRTRVAESSTVPRSFELAGTVIADPAASGLVQAPVSGRIEPGPSGLPLAGQRVARGAVLAWLVPTVGVVERSSRQADLADLDARIEIARARSERYEQLAGSIPQRDIDAARTEAGALVQRRSAMAAGLSGRIALVAPVSGVVSTTNAASGQVVDARDLLFRIIDPSRLMVEALGYDASLAAGVTGGSALAADGRAVPLAWVGAAGQLREQVLPMLFRVGAGAPPLVVGERLRVIAATRTTRTGVVLPAESLVRAANGESVVWVQASAERFLPTRVTAQALDAGRVVVTAGLQPEQRVVTASASLLAQIR